jgi:hypothetical protein
LFKDASIYEEDVEVENVEFDDWYDMPFWLCMKSSFNNPYAG